jgi:hypothetical protein
MAAPCTYMVDGVQYVSVAVGWGGGAIPDLSYSSPEIYEAFDAIVRKGVFLGKGMPDFGDQMSEEDVRDLKHFFLKQAKDEREKRLGFKSIGIVGDALPGDREQDHLPEKTSQEGIWTCMVSLEKGEIKFRADSKWDNNWGGGSFPEGNLKSNGNNLHVISGTYMLTVNLLNNRYVFTPVAE